MQTLLSLNNFLVIQMVVLICFVRFAKVIKRFKRFFVVS